ncbi:MAG TPA: hypothetical protein VGO00_27980, partial [Kofleriaceae bacterium]|nr:hypothetical protein [Kofleriaceae bacterium]
VGEAQHSGRDLLDSLGAIIGADTATVSAALAQALVIDPLNAEQVAANGIDVNGPFALFSDTLDPTFVVHLASAEHLRAFFDGQRAKGMTPRVVTIDGVEVSSVSVGHGISVAWAIDGEWLWIHFVLPGVADDGAWFAASRHGGGSWASDFAWAREATQRPNGVIGLIGQTLYDRIFRDALHREGVELSTCLEATHAVHRIALAASGEGRGHASLRLAMELEPGSAANIQRAILSPSQGWSSLVATAPFAAQWNLDIGAVTGWIGPCLPAIARQIDELRGFGVRAARVAVMSIDPDAGMGTGAVAFDLASADYIARKLDSIPLRSHLESDIKVGSYAGKHLAIPFGPTLDYIFTPKLAMAGVGRGVLARAVGTGPGTGGPLFEIDVRPEAMSAAAWKWLLQTVGAPSSIAIALGFWRDGHVTLSLDGDRLVLDVNGARR